METLLYINTTTCPAAAPDPIELLEVEALVAEAHALEPIRTAEDLANTGRFVAVSGKSQGKSYGEEWPIIKAKAIERYLMPATMNVSYSSLTA